MAKAERIGEWPGDEIVRLVQEHCWTTSDVRETQRAAFGRVDPIVPGSRESKILEEIARSVDRGFPLSAIQNAMRDQRERKVALAPAIEPPPAAELLQLYRAIAAAEKGLRRPSMAELRRAFGPRKTCPDCKGEKVYRGLGIAPPEPCRACKGEGTVPE